MADDLLNKCNLLLLLLLLYDLFMLLHLVV